MRRRRASTWSAVVTRIFLAFLTIWMLAACGHGGKSESSYGGVAENPAAATEALPAGDSLQPDEIATADLPPEARDTLDLIRRGGPFPFAKDGAVFGNRERLLPTRRRGYYREYTVITPESRDRGARRIIAGDNSEYFYTDDHYRSFRRIRE